MDFSGAEWLIDQTDLYAIQYDLLREALVGNIPLGLIGIDQNNKYTSLISGGILTGWKPEMQNLPHKGIQQRIFSILMIEPVTYAICDRVVALQMNGYLYSKKAETKNDGSTPQKWVFYTEYNGSESPINL